MATSTGGADHGGGSSSGRRSGVDTTASDNQSRENVQDLGPNLAERNEDIKQNNWFWHEDEETGEVYMTDLDYYLNSESGWADYKSDYSTDDIDYTRGIWGAPYQFMPATDMRADGSTSSNSMSKFGIEYNERIVARMPILLLTPGRPFFMHEFDKSTTDAVKSALTSDRSLLSQAAEGISELISGKKTGGKYYTLRFAAYEYYQYVNTEARTMAVVLGIQDKPMSLLGVDSGDTIGKYDWSNYTNKQLMNNYMSKEFVAFYVDSETSITDSFSNTTSESMLASAANQVSDVGREIGFLLGTDSARVENLLDNNALNNALNGIDQTLQGLPVVGNLLQDISSKLVTVMTGGKLLFPEIWNDSAFTRSYSVTIKLRTPEPDILSWYINIGVPICHLLSLVLPMQTSGTTNQGYKSPFLVRGVYKGLFNIDMGIITDMQITKGSEGSWTLSGLPMEVDVSITIKELYDAMSMTNNEGIIPPTTILDNDSLLNYIMNTCGVNIMEPQLQRYMKIAENAYTSKITDIPGNMMNALQSGMAQWLYDLTHWPL